VAKAIPMVDKIIFTAVFEMMSTKKQQEIFFLLKLFHPFPKAVYKRQ
jgi:hypothetical protein